MKFCLKKNFCTFLEDRTDLIKNNSWLFTVWLSRQSRNLTRSVGLSCLHLIHSVKGCCPTASWKPSRRSAAPSSGTRLRTVATCPPSFTCCPTSGATWSTGTTRRRCGTTCSGSSRALTSSPSSCVSLSRSPTLILPPSRRDWVRYSSRSTGSRVCYGLIQVLAVSCSSRPCDFMLQNFSWDLHFKNLFQVS